MLTDIRLLSQQLAKPRFKSPKEVVAWMGAIQAPGVCDGEMGGRNPLEVFFVAGGGRCACKGGNPAYPYITADLAFHCSRGYPLDVAIVGRPYTDGFRFLCKKPEDGDNRKFLCERLQIAGTIVGREQEPDKTGVDG